MAEIVNLQSAEYDTALADYRALHETILEDLRIMSSELQALSQVDGGFHVEKLSAKTESLLQILDGQILSLLKTEMELAENAMSDFATVVLQIDTACGA